MSEPQYPTTPPSDPPPAWATRPTDQTPAPATAPPPAWATGPSDQPPPGPPPGTKRGAGVVAIGLAAVAVLAGAAFAVAAVGGGDASGAATPEEAAERLVEAVAAEDVLGLIDLLPAGEREAVRGVVTQARDEYQRLGVLSGDFRLDGFRGVDVTVEGAEFDIEEITDGDGPADGLALATLVGGELRIAVDGDELAGNLGDVVDEVADARDAEVRFGDLTDEADADELGLTFAVVEEGGRWHPSIAFTIAEIARQRSFDELDAPDFADGIDPRGAADPEGAVQALLDAAVDLDPEAAMAVLDPGEARALHVYSQFLDLGPAEVDEDVEISAELTSADVDDLGGGARRVVPTGFELRFTDGEGTAEIVLDDGCLRVEIDPPAGEGEAIDEEVCFDGGGADLPDAFGDVEVPEELAEVAEAFLPLRFGIVTVERGGEHFVSPVRTLADLVLGMTAGLEREDLEPGGAVFALLAGELDDEIEAFFDELSDEALFGDLEDSFDTDFDTDFDFEDDFEPCEGVGCGFGDDDGGFERAPTGASGSGGELLAFDAVAGSVGPDGTATFTVVAEAAGDYVAGAQGVGDFDGVIIAIDPATGAELAFNDDFDGLDPEVLLTLDAGAAVTIEVRGFAGAAGEFVVYFEPF